MSQLKLLFLLFLQAKQTQVLSSFLPSPRHTCSRATTPHMRTFPPRRVSRHSSPTCLLPFSHPSAFLFLPLPLGVRFRPSACLLFCAASSRRSGIVVQGVRLRRVWRPHTRAPPSQESLSGALSFIRRPPNHPTSIPRPAHAPHRLLSPKPAAHVPHMRTFPPRRVPRHSSPTCLLPFSHPSAFLFLPLPLYSPSVRAFGPPPVCSSALPRLPALESSCRPCVSPPVAPTHACSPQPGVFE